MAQLIRGADWAKTALGPPEAWPQSLRSAVSILIPSRAQIILFWGPDFVVLYNDAYGPVFGGKHPWALGRPGREAWSEIWDGALHGLLDGVVRTGDAFWAKDRLFVLERHGYMEETYFDVSYDPVRDETGKVGGVFCIVSETTGRVLAERRQKALRELALRTQNARSVAEAYALSVESMIANAHDLAFSLLYFQESDGGAPLVRASTPGTTSLANAEWPLADVLEAGESRVVPLGASLADAPEGPWDRPPTRAILLPIAAGGGSARKGVLVVGLNPLRPLDDEYRGFLELLASQVSAAIGSALAYETERRRAEALTELDRAKTTFFSNVSHEFRTPLTLLLGPLADVLDRSPGLSDDDRKTLGLAQRNAQRLLKLVNTLLDFSRIEAGRMEATYVPTDLATFTSELASAFDEAVAKAGLRLVIDAPPLSEPAYVDHDMWEKIVLNLLSNALKFTFEGVIGVRLRRVGARAELSVIDSGTGIGESEIPHLFERFWRSPSAKGRTHEGTGIGLALVQELAKLHGGTVRAVSAWGKGSTFTVSIPLGKAHLPPDRIEAKPIIARPALGSRAYAEEALAWFSDGAEGARESEPETERSVELAARPRIVWADDNADMRGYVQRLLSQHYEVSACTNGQSALDVIRERPPDLVLADSMMPELDGLELTRALRSDAATASIPVILLSARAGEEARIEGLAAGADEYLFKPFSARELLARIDSRIELARLQARFESEREVGLREEAALLEELNRVGRVVAAETALDRIMQTVTDAATRLCEAEFGAFFHNVTNSSGESYLLYTLSGAPLEAFSKFGTPRNTAIFAPTFAGEGPVRLDDVTKDPRYGQNRPHRGMPEGHLPVRSYLAVPVSVRSGRVSGGLFFGHSAIGVFDERAERIATGIASLAAVAMQNAELHRQREELIDKLRDADRRKDEFLATLSHELRNPLAPLRNSLNLLMVSGRAVTMTEPLREMMERQVNHLVRLVDDLLEMSRISRGLLELRKEPSELGAIIRTAIETSQPLVDSGRHELAVSQPGEPIWVDGDPVRLAQVVSNLLNNAAKYTDPGGKISLEVTPSAPGVNIVVKDNGVGIAKDSLGEVFEMFSRGERTSSRSQGGLGIGLALARRLVEMHGGAISAESEGPGRGSTFRVTLPVLLETPSTSPLGHVKESGALPPKRVLVVDDNQDSAETLAALLGFLGADVRTAGGGPEALDVFSSYDPAFVFLDIGMPEMDGYEVARRIRSDFPERHPFLIALTGWGQSDDRRQAKEAGFDQHLVKPADFAALQALLTLSDRDPR
jgi:signal transduction histidine kinase/DNA-binding response OmpR family regulator